MAAPCWTTTSRSSNKGSNHGCDQKSGLRSSSWWAATVLLFAAFAPVVTGLAEKECKLDSFRLPRRVQPTNYNLLLRPNLDTWSYSAELTIDLKVLEEESGAGPAGELCESAPRRIENPLKSPACDRRKIILHADPQLYISHVEFFTTVHHDGSASEKQQVQVGELCRDPKNEFLVVSLGQELKHETTGELTLHFSGPIRFDKHGFYRSKHYLDPESGDQRYMALTQFEAAHARKAFPCFDEPDFKSTFDLVIEHPSHLQALSNMHVIKEEKLADDEKESSEEMTRVTFAQTPRMSTYTLAFALGHFEHIEEKVGKMRLAFWTAPGQKNLADNALKFAVRAYERLSDYFGIEQPLKKIDFLVYSDLDGGAMENWGLVTILDSILIYEQHTPPEEMYEAHKFITEMLTLQWLGNLVTMKWWDDLWLNQGFATWFAEEINEQLYPDRDLKLLYLAYLVEEVLDSDASLQTHPIRYKGLEKSEEIENLFDSITGQKAAAVIRMLNDRIGADSFKRGIKDYLANNLYENTETHDLLAALETYSDEDVSHFITSWIDQPGFPLIRARLTGDGRSLRIDQERFLKHPQDQFEKQKWTIPVTMWVSDGDKKIEMLNQTLSEQTGEIKLPSWFNLDKGHWLKLNARSVGFYRVKYEDKRLLQALGEPYEKKLLEPSDRLNLISDLSTLGANSEYDDVEAEQIYELLRTEDNPILQHFIDNYILLTSIQDPGTGLNFPWTSTRAILT